MKKNRSSIEIVLDRIAGMRVGDLRTLGSVLAHEHPGAAGEIAKGMEHPVPPVMAASGDPELPFGQTA